MTYEGILAHNVMLLYCLYGNDFDYISSFTPGG